MMPAPSIWRELGEIAAAHANGWRHFWIIPGGYISRLDGISGLVVRRYVAVGLLDAQRFGPLRNGPNLAHGDRAFRRNQE